MLMILLLLPFYCDSTVLRVTWENYRYSLFLCHWLQAIVGMIAKLKLRQSSTAHKHQYLKKIIYLKPQRWNWLTTTSVVWTSVAPHCTCSVIWTLSEHLAKKPLCVK